MEPVTTATRDGHLELSFAQQRLWFLDQLEPGSAAYNIPVGVRLTVGSTSVRCRAHSTKSFDATSRCGLTSPRSTGSPFRSSPRPGPVEARPRPRESARVRARGCAATDRAGGATSFDLTQDPLLRMTLLRLGADSYVLLVVMHHIISDGWSIGVFTRVGEPLRGVPVGRLRRSRRSRSVTRTTHRAERWLQGERLESQVSYWREQLSGAPAVHELPTDRPRPPVRTVRGSRFSPVSSRRRARRCACRVHAVTPFMAMVAAFMLLLALRAADGRVSRDAGRGAHAA